MTRCLYERSAHCNSIGSKAFGIVTVRCSHFENTHRFIRYLFGTEHQDLQRIVQTTIFLMEIYFYYSRGWTNRMPVYLKFGIHCWTEWEVTFYIFYISFNLYNSNVTSIESHPIESKESVVCRNNKKSIIARVGKWFDTWGAEYSIRYFDKYRRFSISNIEWQTLHRCTTSPAKSFLSPSIRHSFAWLKTNLWLEIRVELVQSGGVKMKWNGIARRIIIASVRRLHIRLMYQQIPSPDNYCK